MALLGIGCAVVAPMALVAVAPASAQPCRRQRPPRRRRAAAPAGADIDPSAPLDAMPDLGVAWPDLARRSHAACADGPRRRSRTRMNHPVDDAPGEPLVVADENAVRNYTVVIAGSTDRAGADVRTQFDAQSALVADRREQANAAQIDRRTRGDVELLSELLRAQGYYDARVEPQLAVARETIAIVLQATPGARYRFEAVDLPGLAASGGEAATLREAFAVKAGDPVVAEQVIAAGSALRVALGEQGFATATVGEQEIVLDQTKKVARLSLPVTPGPVGRFGVIRVSGTPPFSSRHVGRIARFRTGDRFERAMSTTCAARSSPRDGLARRGQAGGARRRQCHRPRRQTRSGAAAHDRRRNWLWHRRRLARRGQLAAS